MDFTFPVNFLTSRIFSFTPNFMLVLLVIFAKRLQCVRSLLGRIRESKAIPLLQFMASVSIMSEK